MIKVVIPMADFEHVNEAMRQVKLIKLLKEKGIPIVGFIAIERPERGTLTMTWDEVFEELTVTWQE